MNWASSARRLRPKHLIHALRIPWSGRTRPFASRRPSDSRLSPSVGGASSRASIRVPCAPLFACAANVPSVEAMAASTASGGTVGGSMRRVSAPSCGEATTSALSSSRNSPTIAATPSAFRTAKPSPALRAFSMTHMRIISAAARHVKCRNGVRNGFRRYWRLFQKKAGQMRRPLL